MMYEWYTVCDKIYDTYIIEWIKSFVGYLLYDSNGGEVSVPITLGLFNSL